MIKLPDTTLHMIEEFADERMEGFIEALEDCVRTYCAEHALARRAVEEFLLTLPRSTKSPQVDAFIGWKTLQQTGTVLTKFAGEAELLREGKDPIVYDSLTKDDRAPAVDDAEIRESAGYGNEEDVAKSSLTDKARDEGIADDDIGKSALPDTFTYKDHFEKLPTPAKCFRVATKILFGGIIDACPKKRLQFLIEQDIVTQKEIHALIQRMRAQIGRASCRERV